MPKIWERQSGAGASSRLVRQQHVNQTSPFLLLPPELRNTIYRLAAVQATRVQVHEHGYERSGLLRVCKQIRTETMNIFYYENRFLVKLPDYNPFALHRFQCSLRAMGYVPTSGKQSKEKWSEGEKRQRGCVRSAIHYYGPNWQNLLEWMRLTHAKEIQQSSLTPAESYAKRTHHKPRSSMLMSMSHMIRLLADRPWSEVRPLLEPHRFILATLDEMWMQG